MAVIHVLKWSGLFRTVTDFNKKKKKGKQLLAKSNTGVEKRVDLSEMTVGNIYTVGIIADLIQQNRAYKVSMFLCLVRTKKRIQTTFRL